MMLIKLLGVCSLTIVVAACGSGAGTSTSTADTTPSPGPSPVTSATAIALQGLWQSTAASGSSNSTIALPDGRVWSIISDAAGVRLIKANVTTADTTLIATGKSYAVVSGTVSSTSLVASGVQKVSLSVTQTTGALQETFNLSYQPRYDTPANLADFAGIWQAVSDGSALNWTVTNAGILSGTRSTGCTYAGQLKLRAELKAVIDVALTETCFAVVKPLTGVATLSADKLHVGMVLTTSDETAGAVLELGR